MSKLKKIMKIKKYDELNIALRKYAHELGVSTDHLVNPETAKTNIPELCSRIGEVERHRTVIKWTIIGVSIALFGIVLAFIYNVLIFPPKYDLSKTSLSYSNDFKYGMKRARREDKKVFGGNVEYSLHFIVYNEHSGEGEISKPILVISSKESDEEYQLYTNTKSTSCEKSGENITSCETLDSGRVIKVGSYGIVDDFFEYRTYRNDRENDLEEFIKIHQGKLEYKIRGVPYGDVKIQLSE